MTAVPGTNVGSVFFDLFVKDKGYHSDIKSAANFADRMMQKTASSFTGIAVASTAKATAQMVNGFANASGAMENGFASGFSKMADQSESLKNRIESVEKQMKDSVTSMGQALDSEFDRLAQKSNEIEEKRQKFLATGGKEDSRAFAGMEYELGKIGAQMDDIARKKELLERDGAKADFGETSSAFQKAQQSALGFNSILEESKAKLNEVENTGFGQKLASGFKGAMQAVPSAAKSAFSGILSAGKTMLSGIGKIMNRIWHLMKAGFQKIGSLAKSVFARIKDHFKKSGDSAGKFTKALNGTVGVLARMAKRKLFTAIWNQAKEGIQELAKFSPAFNKAISDLHSSLKFTGNAFTSAFAPIVQVVAPYLTIFIDKLAQALNMVAQFNAALFGQKTVATAVKTQEDYAKSLDNTASSTKKAAKEAKKSFAAFDEINQLGKPGADSGDSGSAGAGSAFTFDGADTGASAFADRLKSYFDAGDFEAIGAAFADKVNAFIHRMQGLDWDGISNRVNTAVANFARAVNGFVDRLDWYAIGDVIGKGLNIAFGGINTFFRTINWGNIGKGFAKGLNGLLDSLNFKLVGETLANGLNAITGLLHGFALEFDWSKLGVKLSDFANEFVKTFDLAKSVEAVMLWANGILNTLENFATNFDWNALGNKLAAGVNKILTGFDLGQAVRTAQTWVIGLFDAVSTFLVNLDFKGLGENILNGIRNIDWGGLFTSLCRFLGSVWGSSIRFIKDTLWPVLLGIGSDIVDGFKDGIWNGFKNIGVWIYDHIIRPFVDGVKAGLGIASPSKVMIEIGGFVIEGFKQGVKDLWVRVKKFFTDAVSNIHDTFSNIGVWFGSKFTEAWESTKAAFAGVGSFFSDMWERIKASFTNIGQKIGDAIGGAFKNAVNSIFSTIEKTINTPINAINRLIDVINAVPGINLGYLNTLTLPRLAQGGYVGANNPQLAIIGDNTREGEIVAPESKLAEAVERGIAKALAGGYGNMVKELTITLLIKGEDGRTIIKKINAAQAAAGEILIEV